MKLGALVWLAALMASAQPTQVAEIRGVLLEKATERPVRASVTVSLVGKDAGATIETNASGEFVARLGAGTYGINFEGNDQYRPAYLRVELTASDRSKNVRVLLEKLGRVAGRVIDDTTGEPLQGVPVTMMQVRWIKGQLVTEEHLMTTNTEGRFEGSGERDWPWVIGIMPKLVAPAKYEDKVVTKFTEADVELMDEDYEESYWPGGVRVIGEALPVPYVAGQTTDVGNIRVRKAKYRRALLHFPVDDCIEGRWFDAKFVEPRDETRDFGLPCGKDLLLRGLISGRQYKLKFTGLDSGSAFAWRTGVLEFVVGDRNPELRVMLTRGMDLQGRLLFAEGSSVPKTPLRLSLKHGDLWQERLLDKEGQFQFENVPLGEQIFYLGSEDGHYAQHVKINGTEAQGMYERKFEWTGQGTLEVVVDDQPGTIGGTVKDGDRGAPRATVTVVPWPVPAGNSIFDVRYGLDADTAGQYQVGRLPAGDYRVVAVPWEAREKLEEPGVLERLLARGEKVTLGRGSALNLDVRVVELK